MNIPGMIDEPVKHYGNFIVLDVQVKVVVLFCLEGKLEVICNLSG